MESNPQVQEASPATAGRSRSTVAGAARAGVKKDAEVVPASPLCKRLVKNKRNFKRVNRDGVKRYYPTGTVIECPVAEVKGDKLLREGTVAYKGPLGDGEMLSEDRSDDVLAADEEI